MSSSWTEDADGTRPSPPFLSVDRGSLVRLVAVLALGAAALVGPLLGRTSASFTDSTDVGVTFSVPAPVPPTVPAPGPDPVP
jgi:hypothetical protein